MNAEQFLKEHETEALKKIAEAVRPDKDVEICMAWECGIPIELVCVDDDIFEPLEDGEQWIECLVWYRKAYMDTEDYYISGMTGVLFNATESREALLVAILELIGGWNEKEI